MKNILQLLTFLILFAGISLTISGQDGKASKEDRKEQREWEKQKRKEEKEAQKEQMKKITKLMVDHHKFVLEADYLSDKYGTRVPVDHTINFIMIDSLHGTIQFGSAWAAGYNGVGGATFNGNITKYKVSAFGKKKDSYNIQIIFMSSIGTYDISLMVGGDGNADASVRGNWSGQLNYHGRLVPLGISRVYKGHARY